MTREDIASSSRNEVENIESRSLLLSVYNECNTEARWQENCREKSASVIITANSIIVGIIATFKLQFPFILFCVIQYLLARTGQKFILKYHALAERRHAYANGLLESLEKASGQPVKKILTDVRNNQRERFEKESRLAKQLIQVDRETGIHELWYHLHSGFKRMSLLLAVLIIIIDLQQTRSEGYIYRMWDYIAHLF
jgi:hypothetical protein